jgi:hypothetical protein
VPQAPQLRPSEVTSMHSPAHAVRPEEHTQAPSTQVLGAKQARPQAPQWALSERLSTQVPPQVMKGGVHPGPMHAPRTQVALSSQRVPHLPQLKRSSIVSLQIPLQRVRPVGHPTQPPSSHSCRAGQTLPQAPQFSRSKRRFRHRRPQARRGGMHRGGTMQAPSAHTCSPTQARSHIPQWAELVRVFTQAAPQRVSPAPQGVMQAPSSHVWAAVHARPQPPQ